ncbi:hypothetical protein D0T12_22425 [Actinomadura spongiicola]|uniref:Uncharacterized protein n=1 Tax=Actinomadura spongiicola TaxID=2303421 RepID=A0A372GC88_9ACTN|nr:hypothetical protein [Actinomadura spongiicola]RFS82960.1 hypothetical protein D0T12_22425 [Actinomadura spongiicola]
MTGTAAAGTLTFSDNLTPSAPRGTYSITVAQKLPPGLGGTNPTGLVQTVQVTGLRLHLGEQEVHGAYPPPGSCGPVQTLLPHIAFERRVLPWETRLDWKAGDSENKKRPWLALLLFTKGELVDDPEAAGLTTQGTAGELLVDAKDPLRLPTFTPALTDAEKATPVHTIRVTKDVFAALAPLATEVAHLAHVRGPLPGETSAIGLQDEERYDKDEDNEATRRATEYSFVVANRLPYPGPKGAPYVAHLVSLEGHTEMFDNPGSLTKDIRLLSLYSWSFTSSPQGEASFSELRRNLTREASDTADRTREFLLRHPQPATTGTDDFTRHVRYRLANGWIPLAHDNGVPDDFAWYRGPLVPYKVTAPSETDAKYGAADLSYAVARELGRALVLADQEMAAALGAYLDRAHGGLAQACRVIAPLLDPALLDPDLAARPRDTGDRADLRRAVDDLLTGADDRWRAAFDRVACGEPVHRHGAVLTSPAPSSRPHDGPLTDQQTIQILREQDLASHHSAPALLDLMKTLLARDDILDAIAEHTLGGTDPAEPKIIRWLDRLRRLEQVPFDHLVPHTAMLPPESLRIFRVDTVWLDALTEGAFRAAERSRLDRRALDALRAGYRARAAAPPKAGVLIRSRLVSAYPRTEVVVSKSQADGSKDARGRVLRRDRIAPDVLLCLFDGLPARIELHEPMHGLHLGVFEDLGRTYIGLRSLVEDTGDGVKVGQSLKGKLAEARVEVPFRRTSGPGAHTIKINQAGAGLAALVWDKLTAKYRPPGGSAAGPGDLALQMVQSPEKATLTITGS